MSAHTYTVTVVHAADLSAVQIATDVNLAFLVYTILFIQNLLGLVGVGFYPCDFRTWPLIGRPLRYASYLIWPQFPIG